MVVFTILSHLVQTVQQVDVIIGPLGIIMAHAMLGEVTPAMAEAISRSPARKILLPLSQENVEIAGIENIPLPRLIEVLIEQNLSL